MDMKEMFRITSLIKAGGIAEATEIIQRSLKNDRYEDADNQSEDRNNQNIIEGTCRVIDEVNESSFAYEENQEPLPFSINHFQNKFKDLQESIEQLTRSNKQNNASHVKRDKKFIEGSFSNHIGTRTYKLYIPENTQAESLPLIVMLHGCTQDPDDFAAGTRMNTLAEEYQCFVLYPCQSQAASQLKCWNWFNESDQKRDHGEPSIIAGMTQSIIRDYAIDPQKVYIAGLSAGGAMAAIMGITYPDIYAAVGVHSGLPYGIADDLPSALAAMKGKSSKHTPHKMVKKKKITNRMPPMIIFHGDKDTKVHSANADQLVEQHISSHTYHEHTIPTERKLRLGIHHGKISKGHDFQKNVYRDDKGKSILEHWLIKNAGHAWSGGDATGSHTDPKGPDASKEMIRFFYQHQLIGS